MKYFYRLHPAVTFSYLAVVLTLSMLTLHPVAVSLCLVSGIAFYGMLKGARKFLRSLALTVPLILLVAVTNPLFVHRGATVLFFLNGSPFTLEATVYGAVSAMRLAAVLYWCRCYSEVMTADKFIYLFGKLIPKLSLTLCVTLAFIPRLKRKLTETEDAQRALGIYASMGYVDRLRSRLRIMSALISNALEGAIDTADVMKARGYGIAGRSSYAVYRFTPSDALGIALTFAVGGASVVLAVLVAGDTVYYPYINVPSLGAKETVFYALVALLCGAAAFLEIRENVLWHYLKSRI